jgi:hypothetical protein
MYVIKISENYKLMGREIEALKDIRNTDKINKIDYPYDLVPVIISKGMFILEKPKKDSGQAYGGNNEESNSEMSMTEDKKFLSFYVMPKYGQNLE